MFIINLANRLINSQYVEWLRIPVLIPLAAKKVYFDEKGKLHSDKGPLVFTLFILSMVAILKGLSEIAWTQFYIYIDHFESVPHNQTMISQLSTVFFILICILTPWQYVFIHFWPSQRQKILKYLFKQVFFFAPPTHDSIHEIRIMRAQEMVDAVLIPLVEARKKAFATQNLTRKRANDYATSLLTEPTENDIQAKKWSYALDFADYRVDKIKNGINFARGLALQFGFSVSKASIK